MSQYHHGQRRPNVSAYLANLNQIPPAHEIPSDIHLGGDDLDFLTNTEFFDFDSFHVPSEVNFNHAAVHDGETKGHGRLANGLPPTQYQFNEFQTYPTPLGSSVDAAYPQQGHNVPYAPQPGDKRKPSATTTIPSAADLEEQSRMAAEEDKRRRNTAASARFRVKKKQREAALEKQAKEMTDKVQQLEGKVQQLEMENKWLKGLITEKADGKAVEVMERKADEKTDGVGTAREEVKAEV